MMDNQRAMRAEQALLGCLICENSVWDRIADLIDETDFALSSHRAIFDAIARAAEKDEPFDVVTLAERIEADGKLESIGGLSMLGILVDGFTTAANAKSYAMIIRDQSMLRRTARTAEEVADQARAGEAPPAEILEIAQQRLSEIADAHRAGGLSPVRVAMTQAVTAIDEAFLGKADVIGTPSGFADLDKLTSGFARQDLVILAARPSMGKTAMALAIADHVAVEKGRAVALFSLEMSSESIGMRLLSTRAGLDLMQLRQGDLSDAEWSRLTSATARISTAPLYIDDSASLTIAEMTARARRLQREHPLSLVIVDYLQLIGSTGRAENRNVEVMRISQGLKALAKSINVPVIALSQLSRAVEQRPNKRPMMSDLRDSGGIEQDADLILFLYRDEVYNDASPQRGTAEVIIAKQRNGPTGMARLAFLKSCCRFENLARDWRPDPVAESPRPRRRRVDEVEY